MSALAHPAVAPRRRDLDFLRVCAMFAVIAIHCVMPITILLVPTDADWPVAEVIDSYMRWAVPIFVMISGALLIRKEAFANLSEYIRRRIGRILIPFIAWPVLYALWLIALGDPLVTWASFWNGIVTGEPIGASHLYFMFIIVGLYILNPLISLYASKVSRRVFLLSAIAALVAAATWHTVASILPSLTESYSALTWCLPFIGYFMLGYALKDIWVNSRQALGLLAGFIGFGLFNAFATIVTRMDGHFFFQSYISPTVIGLSVCAFLGGRLLYTQLVALVTDHETKQRLRYILDKLSWASFGIYLVHVMILETIVYTLGLYQGSLQTAALLFIVVPPLAFATVVVLGCIPGIRRLVI